MENKLENRDYVLVIDKSGSMSEKDTKSGKSRWAEAQETTKALANKVADLDPDGITVYVFAGGFKKYEGVTPAKVTEIFNENEPGGGTTLAPVIADIFGDYTKRKAAGTNKAHGEMCFVITDGQPSDENQVAKEIVKFGNSLLGRDEYGISLLQVGRDPNATAFLQRLDDNLAKEGAKNDIVDAKTMDEVEELGLTAILMAALED